MKINELIEALEDYRDAYGNVEVRIQTQQSWPFECLVLGAVARCDFEEIDKDNKNAEANCVFIVEGGQLKYGSKSAWDHV